MERTNNDWWTQSNNSTNSVEQNTKCKELNLKNEDGKHRTSTAHIVKSETEVTPTEKRK